MKQGTGSGRAGAQKQEPSSHAVDVCNVADMGLAHIGGNSSELYKGRGLEAPMSGTQTHHSGSQGKH